MKLRRALARWTADRDGTVAVEFAIVGPIFFLLCFGLIELTVFQLRSEAVQGFVNDAARRAQLGEIQTAADLCPRASALVACDEVTWDVRVYSEMEAVAPPAMSFSRSGASQGQVFQKPGPDQFVVVRAGTVHRFVTPMVDRLVGGGADGAAAARASALIKTERWVTR